MAKIAKALTELIGNTPLLELSRFGAARGLGATVLGKLEYFNPGGSVKDRIGLAMIEDAEQKGLLDQRHRHRGAHQRQHGHRAWR